LRIRDKFREAAATLVSTFLTRDTILPEILDWAVRTLSEENWFKANMTICAVTKHDMREDVLKYADTNLTRLQAGNLKEHLNTNLSKLGWVAWRYQRGSWTCWTGTSMRSSPSSSPAKRRSLT
jgi:hypothetical protein